MTPEAKKHCEELAESQCERLTSTLVDADSRKRHFLKGFQAGYSYNEERLKLAVEALEKQKQNTDWLIQQEYSRHYNLDGNCNQFISEINEALSKIKALRGDG